MRHFTDVKVFSATTLATRNALGDEVTAWLARHPGIVLVDKELLQSSDDAFHCVKLTLFYRRVAPGRDVKIEPTDPPYVAQ